jgi:monoamine oxidase
VNRMPEQLDVAVIGAGLAGLRAATDLLAAGRDVVVFEARDRVGGRVWSHRFPNGQWCERGAEFIDSNHTEVLSLAQSLGLDLLDATKGRDDAKRLLDVGGRPAPFALHHSLQTELAWWHEAQAKLAALVDPDDPTASESAADLDLLSLSDFLTALHLSVATRVAVGRELRTEFMVGPDGVSQLMAGWMFARHLQAGDGYEAFRIAGGNDQLTSGLAAPLGDRVRLGAAVADIDASGAIIMAGGERATARQIVAAVPLPVLSRIWPVLPDELAAVGYGVGGKVSVQTDRRIWQDYGRDGAVLTDRAWGEMWDTSEHQPGDGGVLTALLSSNDGAALAALPDTVERVIDEADRLFPGFKGMSGDAVRTDWTHDPYSLGAYATFGPGQLRDAWPKLRERYGRIVLAGEHTDEFCGFMEGALRSGARVARELLTGG